MKEEASDRLKERMAIAAQALLEHCDSVVVLCTLREDGETIALESAYGNAFAIDGSLSYAIRRRKNIDLQSWNSGEDEI